MRSPYTFAARVRLALLCAALAVVGGALPARAAAPAASPTEVILVLRPGAPRPQRSRAPLPQAVPPAPPRRPTASLAAPPAPSRSPPRLHVLYRALLR